MTSRYVNFDVDGELVPVPYDTAIRSEYIKTLLSEFDDSIIITVPDKFFGVINNYINFLWDKHNGIILDKQQYELLFNMYTYFDDDDYFKYLVSQTIKHWCDVSSIVYNNLMPELQWQIYLHCSYHVIPKSYLTNANFYLEWSALNKQVKCDDGKGGVYYNNFPVNYGQHCYDTNKYVCWHDENNTDSSLLTVIANGYKHGYDTNYGLEVGFYALTGNIKYLRETNCDKLHGKSIIYYNDSCHTIARQGNYNMEQKDGLWETWYEFDSTMFVDYKPVLESQVTYINCNKHGQYNRWYNDDNHTLAETGECYHGRKIGTWTTWWYPIDHSSDDNKVTNNSNKPVIKEQGKYVYDLVLMLYNTVVEVTDKKDGVWTRYDKNGNITFTETYHRGKLVKQ